MMLHRRSTPRRVQKGIVLERKIEKATDAAARSVNAANLASHVKIDRERTAAEIPGVNAAR